MSRYNTTQPELIEVATYYRMGIENYKTAE